MLVNVRQENLKSIEIQISAVQILLNHLNYDKFTNIDEACNNFYYHYFEVLEKFKDYNDYYHVNDRAHELDRKL